MDNSRSPTKPHGKSSTYMYLPGNPLNIDALKHESLFSRPFLHSTKFSAANVGAEGRGTRGAAPPTKRDIRLHITARQGYVQSPFSHHSAPHGCRRALGWSGHGMATMGPSTWALGILGCGQRGRRICNHIQPATSWSKSCSDAGD